MRYLALGDSYTIGESVGPEERWPVRLVHLLRGEGLAVAEPVIVARTGWTTRELTAGIDRAALRGPFELVSLLIGVNDQYRGEEVVEYRRSFRTVLRRAISLVGGEAGRVVVLSIPDWGTSPFAEGRDRREIAAGIDLYNGANRAETDGAGARYVDITGASRRVAPPASESPFAADGLHPSGVQHAEWARLALPQALEALGGARSRS